MFESTFRYIFDYMWDKGEDYSDTVLQVILPDLRNNVDSYIEHYEDSLIDFSNETLNEIIQSMI